MISKVNSLKFQVKLYYIVFNFYYLIISKVVKIKEFLFS